MKPDPKEVARGAVVVPPPIERRDCDICGDPARHRFEIQRKVKGGTTGSGIFLFACDGHRQMLELEALPKRARPDADEGQHRIVA